MDVNLRLRVAISVEDTQDATEAEDLAKWAVEQWFRKPGTKLLSCQLDEFPELPKRCPLCSNMFPAVGERDGVPYLDCHECKVTIYFWGLVKC